MTYRHVQLGRIRYLRMALLQAPGLELPRLCLGMPNRWGIIIIIMANLKTAYCVPAFPTSAKVIC
jgi:hypothetical protein